MGALANGKLIHWTRFGGLRGSFGFSSGFVQKVVASGAETVS